MPFRVSYATHSILEGKKLTFSMPTAYVLIGEECQNNCLFCTFSTPAPSVNRKWLSRISWIRYKVEDFFKKAPHLFSRICFQLACSRDAIDFLKEQLSKYRLSLPASLSCWISSAEEIKFFLEQGVEKIALNLDIIGKNHTLIKGGNFQSKLHHIIKVATRFLGHITTHIIIGCGETDKEIVDVLHKLLDAQVTVSFFPYTPFKKLSSEDNFFFERPSLKRYRLLQLYLYLKNHPELPQPHWIWKDDMLTGIEMGGKDLEVLAKSCDIFMTQGCQFCTRPYYNDNPSSDKIYNHHLKLSYTKNLEILTSLLSKQNIV